MAKQRERQAAVVLILAANMKRIFAMADRLPDYRNRSTPERLCEWITDEKWEDRIGKTTVYKMLNGDGPVVIDQVELVARAFEMEAWHLLTPDLDPANPPYLVRTKEERELWKKIERLTEVEREKATKREDARGGGHQEGNAQSSNDDHSTEGAAAGDDGSRAAGPGD